MYDAVDRRVVKRVGHRPAAVERQRRGRDRRPRAFLRRKRLASPALRDRARGRLPAAMRELNAKPRMRKLPGFVHELTEGSLMRIRIEPETRMRAAADLLDSGRLHDDQACSGEHEASDMHEMPGLRRAAD